VAGPAGVQTDDVPNPPDVSVLVVDDQAPFRSAARAVVERTRGFRWVGEADSGEAAVERAAELVPDLVLMDINLGEVSGIEATRRIVADRPETVVVLASSYAHTDLPTGARECGAVAYVHKEELSGSELQRLWDDRLAGWPAG
jgi:DNA-binding NarL/FixJ family response regulator